MFNDMIEAFQKENREMGMGMEYILSDIIQ